MKQENIDKLSRLLDKPAIRVEQISEEDIKSVQRILKAEGLYQGKIDGDFGGGTSRGLLKAFEHNPSLINSLSPAYLKLMQENGYGKQLQELVAGNARITADLVADTKKLLNDPKYAKHHSFQQSNLYLLGYYGDEIDGIKGKNHKDAIREFREKYPSASPAEPAQTPTPAPAQIPAREKKPDPPPQPVGETRLAREAGESTTTVSAAPATSGPPVTTGAPPQTVVTTGNGTVLTSAPVRAAPEIRPAHLGPNPGSAAPAPNLANLSLRATHDFIQSRAIDPIYAPLYPAQVDTDTEGAGSNKGGLSAWQRFKNFFNGKSEGAPEQQSVAPQTAPAQDIQRLWGMMEQARDAGMTAPKADTGYEPYEPILALIRQKESGDNYDIGHNHVDKGYSRMTINQVIKDQEDWCNRRRAAGLGIYSYFEGRASSVAGAYQIKHSTLLSLVKELDLTGDEKFDKAMQNRLATALLNRRGYDDYLAGEIKTNAMVRNLSGEWASFPEGPSNESRYNDRNNKALIGYKPTHDILQYVRSEFQEQAGNPSAGTQFATNIPRPETAQPATPAAATEDAGTKPPKRDHHSVLSTDIRFT
jgi:muramidase (phage lysozyme)